MSERVKMNIDQEDREWEWLKKKLIKMKKTKLSSKAKAKKEQESQEKEKASKLEDGALVSGRQLQGSIRQVVRYLIIYIK